MKAFETTAILNDASHLTLHQPVPLTSIRECRVIVLFDAAGDITSKWPIGFFDEILVEDPAFARPPQGQASPITALDV